jgi:hypothetical protein
MLLPVSVTAPIRITSPSRPQSLNQLDSFSPELFIGMNTFPYHSRSRSRMPFQEKSIDEYVPDLERELNSCPKEFQTFDDPGSGQTTAVPTRQPSPSPQPITINTKPAENNSPKRPLTNTRRRGRSGTSRKINLRPLITRPRGRSISKARRTSPSWNLGQRPQNLKRVGVDVCLRWLTDAPQSRTVPSVPKECDSQAEIDEEKASTEGLVKIVEDAIADAESTLESLVVDQNNLYLHTQHFLSFAEIDTDGDMFRLEGRIADLEECVERMKVLGNDVRYVHRWCIMTKEESEGGKPGPFFEKVDIERRLRECFTPSAWWKDYEFGTAKRASSV